VEDLVITQPGRLAAQVAAAQVEQHQQTGQAELQIQVAAAVVLIILAQHLEPEDLV
jgi:hypothetical protein